VRFTLHRGSRDSGRPGKNVDQRCDHFGERNVPWFLAPVEFSDRSGWILRR